MSGAFGIDSGMCMDEVCMLVYAVDNIHSCVIAMRFRQFDYEVNSDHIPWCKGNLTDLRRILHSRECSKDPWLGQSTMIYKGMQYQAS
jgi:hypothetical protein